MGVSTSSSAAEHSHHHHPRRASACVSPSNPNPNAITNPNQPKNQASNFTIEVLARTIVLPVECIVTLHHNPSSLACLSFVFTVPYSPPNPYPPSLSCTSLSSPFPSRYDTMRTLILELKTLFFAAANKRGLPQMRWTVMVVWVVADWWLVMRVAMQPISSFHFSFLQLQSTETTFALMRTP